MISDKDLRLAARKYEKALLSTLPEPEDCAAVFSSGFERKMKRLILRVDHPLRFWLRWILPVLLAAGAAAAAVLLPGQAEEPPAPPEPEPPAAADPEPEAPRTVAYRLTWLPEGCEWDREALYENEGMVVYRTPSGAETVFLYTLDGDPVSDAAPETGREVLVDDAPALLCLGESKEEQNELFWSDGEASFWLTAPFGEEDMIRAAESAEPVE